MISYAQNFEDVMLERVFRNQATGFYIDVGAWDPVLDSVTKTFYDRGWCGLNIEPNGNFHAKLVQERPRDINLNIALGEREETRKLFVFEEFGNSTFQSAHRDSFQELGHESHERDVTVRTLAAVCREFVKDPIDFMKVDCEGWEEYVLKGADWARFRPTVLVVEATKPGTPEPAWADWEPYLAQTARYEMVYFDGLNRYFVPEERSADLRPHFEFPPNVFDAFKTYGTFQVELENQALRASQSDLQKAVSDLEQQLTSLKGEAKTLHETNAFLTADRDRALSQASVLAARISELESERTHLTSSVGELQQIAKQNQDTIVGMEAKILDLEKKLLKAQLWVGRLSQDLAKRRL